MSDQFIVLKQTKLGLVKDTIVSANDTLLLNLKNKVQLVFPEEILQVNALEQPKSDIEIIAIWVGVIVGVVTIGYTLYSIFKLFQKADNGQEQLDKLAGLVKGIEAQNLIITEGNSVMRDYFAELQNLISTGTGSSAMAEIEQKRFRLSVKPRIWINGSGYNGSNGTMFFDLNNRGELCHYDGYEFISGDAVSFNSWQTAVEIPKEGRIKINGRSQSGHPKDIKFKLKLMYHDQEGFKYESILEWNKSAKIIETTEL
jgi:hypothetical protein